MSGTLRQKLAVQKISEILRKSNGHKNVSMGRVLREAGYSESVARHPDNVTKAKGFRELLGQIMPPEKVVKLQAELIEASKLNSYKIDSRLDDKEITATYEDNKICKVRNILRDGSKPYALVYTWSPDYGNRLRALDMYYKLNNLYPKKKEESETNAEVGLYLDKLAKILP